MLKENGRLHPKKEVEVSFSKGKKYQCAHCNYTMSIREVEFGMVYKCPKCKYVMEESFY